METQFDLTIFLINSISLLLKYIIPFFKWFIPWGVPSFVAYRIGTKISFKLDKTDIFNIYRCILKLQTSVSSIVHYINESPVDEKTKEYEECVSRLRKFQNNREEYYHEIVCFKPFIPTKIYKTCEGIFNKSFELSEYFIDYLDKKFDGKKESIDWNFIKNLNTELHIYTYYLIILIKKY